MIRVMSITMLAILIIGCEEKIRPTVMGGVSSTTLPSEESWNATITVSDSGIIKAIVKAGHIYSYENSTITYLEDNVQVDFYDEWGEHTSVLTSQKGSVNEGTNDLEAIGNVIVQSDSGVVVKTEMLFWDNELQRIHSDEFVSITSPTERLQGTGFESDPHLKNYKIYKVTGTADSK